MKLQNGVFPEHILIGVPKGRVCNIDGQIFSTDDLPDKLLATYEGFEIGTALFREVRIAKYSVEPIFGLRIFGGPDYCGNTCYNIDGIKKLCEIISQPWMHSIRSSTLQDKFIRRNIGENPYWLYTPEYKYKLTFVSEGKICTAEILDYESGYYYELKRSGEDSVIRKVGDKSNLIVCKPMAVKPVIFLDAKAFEKTPRESLAIA